MQLPATSSLLVLLVAIQKQASTLPLMPHKQLAT
jgi:hypothetical protein